MKLLVGSIEALFKALPQSTRVVYWDTVLRTSYSSGIPITRYTIRVTGFVNHADFLILAEATLPCGSHAGESHDEIDSPQKEKVFAYKQKLQEEIEKLAKRHGVELRAGILTLDPAESLHGMVKE